MILQDFACVNPACGHEFEEMDASDAERRILEEAGETYKVFCPKCSADVKVIFNGTSAHFCETLIPTYPGCKRQKAGYTHTSHADQKATKLQSGYGGCQGPS